MSRPKSNFPNYPNNVFDRIQFRSTFVFDYCCITLVSFSMEKSIFFSLYDNVHLKKMRVFLRDRLDSRSVELFLIIVV